MHGHGKVIKPCGDVYEGSFENDLKHGEGQVTYANNNGTFKGYWEKGVRRHLGIYTLRQTAMVPESSDAFPVKGESGEERKERIARAEKIQKETKVKVFAY